MRNKHWIVWLLAGACVAALPATRAAEPRAAVGVRGDAQAEYRLAQSYQRGLRVTADAQAVMRLLRQSAAQGYAPAQCDLGVTLLARPDDPATIREAIGWLKKAAAQHFPAAEADLGNLYLAGIGVAPDVRTAAQWYRRAADQGLAAAQFSLGLMQETGLGMAPDAAAAVASYRQAAAQQYEPAMLRLGMLYHLGRGVKADDRMALGWLEAAAVYGDPRAQALAGGFYQIAWQCSIHTARSAVGWR